MQDLHAIEWVTLHEALFEARPKPKIWDLG